MIICCGCNTRLNDVVMLKVKACPVCGSDKFQPICETPDDCSWNYELFPELFVCDYIYPKCGQSPQKHAPDKIGGTDEGSEGSGNGLSKAVNEPES